MSSASPGPIRWRSRSEKRLTGFWLSAALEERPVVRERDRKSTRLNSSHEWISYAVFCLKKKKQTFRVTKTEGNFNNQVGLPRSRLHANRDRQFAGCGLEMNYAGEDSARGRMASADADML